jgi:hypothetical protein
MLAVTVWDDFTIFWVCLFSVPIVAIIGAFWFKLESERSENDLKRSMVERGMSPEDIERVISARPPKR